MNDDFEKQLLGLELRRPPADWKALLLPGKTPPLFTRPWLLGLAACWMVSLGLRIATPETTLPGPAVVPPTAEPVSWDLALATPTER